MASEVIHFELHLHFEPALEGSINDLRQSIIRCLTRNIDEIQDIELDCTGSERR